MRARDAGPGRRAGKHVMAVVVVCLLTLALTACGQWILPLAPEVGPEVELLVPESSVTPEGDSRGSMEETAPDADETTEVVVESRAPLPTVAFSEGEDAVVVEIPSEDFAEPEVERAAPASEEGLTADIVEMPAPSDSAASGDAAHPLMPTVAPSGGTHAHPEFRPRLESVTAGVVDDNEQWQSYLDYREAHRYLLVNDRDVSERYILQVWDSSGQPVHDAVVEITAGQQQFVFEGRTDAGGRLLFFPRAVAPFAQQFQPGRFDVTVRKGQAETRASFDRNSETIWQVTLPAPLYAPPAQLDLLFLIDATGSMSDEIDKLKISMGDIATQIATLPEQPDVRYGLVVYRDRGDEFVVRAYDFTPDLDAFQRTLALVYADGGGDEPESLNEALHRSLNDLHWRQSDTVRMILLVADAPPHLDYAEPYSYDTDMIEAVRRGIKIFPVGASGLNDSGEYIFRQLAQFTGGKFVFLTYAEAGAPESGPGVETDHHVSNYSVDTLDRLVVRLVREELAKLPRSFEQDQ